MANNNNKLAIVGVGCLFLLGLFGLSCMGLGTIGFLYMRTPTTQVAAVAEEPPAATRVDLLSDASFLDVGAGPFVAPVAVPAEPEEPIEPLRPVIQPAATRPTPRAVVPAPPPSAPEEPLIEDDQEPIISDEDVQALDAEVQQIQAEKEAEAATDSKKKKKNR